MSNPQSSSSQSSNRIHTEYPFLPNTNYKECVEVYQQGYGITTSEKPFISTFGLGPCIAIVGYCNETQNAFMIHADSDLLINNNIQTLYYHLNEANTQASNTQASNTHHVYDMYLFGGNYGESSEEFAEKIKYEFNKMNRWWRNRVEIIFHSSYINMKITNICIDSNSGKFYSVDPHKCILHKSDTFMKCFEMSCVMNAQTGYKSLKKYN